MSAKSVYGKCLAFAFCFFEIYSLTFWENSFPFTLPVFLWWGIFVLMLVCLKMITPSFFRQSEHKFWSILIILNIGYAFFYMAENYWDYRMLVENVLIYSVPLFAIPVFIHPDLVGRVLGTWFKYCLIVFLITMPFTEVDCFPRIMSPFVLLLLSLKAIPSKWKCFALVALIVVFTISGGSRSEVLKFGVAALLGIFCIVCHRIPTLIKLVKPIRFLCFILPIFLFAFALSGSFNIFSIGEEKKTEETENRYADTRTFLYEENILSAINNSYIIQGRSLARGYDCIFFEDDDVNRAKGGRGSERAYSEVSILNIFTYFGLIGVFFFSLFYFKSSSIAVKQSNNIYVPVIGVYVSFKWALLFIEEFAMFDLSFFFTWVLISLCYSPRFRAMSNIEFENWIKKILS